MKVDCGVCGNLGVDGVAYPGVVVNHLLWKVPLVVDMDVCDSCVGEFGLEAAHND